MTYCLGIVTKHGLIMASDSRSNAGYDQVNTVEKMQRSSSRASGSSSSHQRHPVARRNRS